MLSGLLLKYKKGVQSRVALLHQKRLIEMFWASD